MDLSNIRTLKADEIEVRIGAKAKSVSGASLLLYKNSRVDMAILDELVGPMNWQRDHKELKGVIYCGVAIKNDNEWIWKWDAGVESNTEPQKGEASDSFKRACVNWGIGRELYTAPFIWVNLTAEEWNDGKPRINFRVSQITYNKQRAISSLIIVDGKGHVRYSFEAAIGKAAKAVEASQPAPSPAPAAPAPAPGEPPPTTTASCLTGTPPARQARTAKGGCPSARPRPKQTGSTPENPPQQTAYARPFRQTCRILLSLACLLALL